MSARTPRPGGRATPPACAPRLCPTDDARPPGTTAFPGSPPDPGPLPPALCLHLRPSPSAWLRNPASPGLQRRRPPGPGPDQGSGVRRAGAAAPCPPGPPGASPPCRSSATGRAWGTGPAPGEGRGRGRRRRSGAGVTGARNPGWREEKGRLRLGAPGFHPGTRRSGAERRGCAVAATGRVPRVSAPTPSPGPREEESPGPQSRTSRGEAEEGGSQEDSAGSPGSPGRARTRGLTALAGAAAAPDDAGPDASCLLRRDLRLFMAKSSWSGSRRRGAPEPRSNLQVCGLRARGEATEATEAAPAVSAPPATRGAPGCPPLRAGRGAPLPQPILPRPWRGWDRLRPIGIREGGGTSLSNFITPFLSLLETKFRTPAAAQGEVRGRHLDAVISLQATGVCLL